MSFPDPFITTDQSGQGNRFRCRKSRVPPGTMRSGRNRLALGIFVSERAAMSDQLFTRDRVLALAQSRKLFSAHGPSQPVLFGQAPLPRAVNFLSSGPIALFRGGEFLLVVTLRLPGSKRF